ncbi:hypothetical protein GCM10010295_23080 [Streptomyces intermedius]
MGLPEKALGYTMDVTDRSRPCYPGPAPPPPESAVGTTPALPPPAGVVACPGTSDGSGPTEGVLREPREAPSAYARPA